MITWSSYLSGITYGLLGYYSIVLLLFYRKELIGKLRPANTRQPASVNDGLSTKGNLPASENGAAMVSLVDEIHAYIIQAGASPIEKTELMFGLKKLLDKHPPVEDSFIRQGITNLIKTVAESKCGIVLSEEDLGGLW